MSRRTNAEIVRTELEPAAIRDRDLDLEVATDWLAVDTEAWHKLDIEELQIKTAGRGGARSTSPRSTRQ